MHILYYFKRIWTGHLLVLEEVGVRSWGGTHQKINGPKNCSIYAHTIYFFPYLLSSFSGSSLSKFMCPPLRYTQCSWPFSLINHTTLMDFNVSHSKLRPLLLQCIIFSTKLAPARKYTKFLISIRIYYNFFKSIDFELC